MQYNQNYRYQQCLLFFFQNDFKIGCQSPYAKKTGEQCKCRVFRLWRKRNELYIYTVSIRLPGDLFVRPAELMSESIYYTLPTRCYRGEEHKSHPIAALCALYAKYRVLRGQPHLSSVSVLRNRSRRR